MMFILSFWLVILYQTTIAERESDLINYITCENRDEVAIDVDEIDKPHEHGKARGVYHGTLKGLRVIVKRPILSLLEKKFSKSQETFRAEAEMMKRLRGHPGIPHLYGSCLDPPDKADLMIVTNPLTPFAKYLEEKVDWCVRVHSAITMMSLLEYLQNEWRTTSPNKPAFLHCDLNRMQFAFTPEYEVSLVDFKYLAEITEFPYEAVPCRDRATCDSQMMCLRSWRTEAATMSEFECNADKGTCGGFDPRATLWVVCESVLTHLIDPSWMSTHHAPHIEAIGELMRGCLAKNRKERWSAAAVGNALRAYLNANGGFQCLHNAGVRLNAAYYDADARITIATRERAPVVPVVFTPPKSGGKLKPFPAEPIPVVTTPPAHVVPDNVRQTLHQGAHAHPMEHAPIKVDAKPTKVDAKLAKVDAKLAKVEAKPAKVDVRKDDKPIVNAPRAGHIDRISFTPKSLPAPPTPKPTKRHRTSPPTPHPTPHPTPIPHDYGVIKPGGDKGKKKKKQNKNNAAKKAKKAKKATKKAKIELAAPY